MCDRHTANIWTARVMPLIILGMVVYSAYVFVGVVCIGYLLNPPKTAADSDLEITPATPKRTGAVIGLLIPYIAFLTLVITTYVHLVYTVTFNPGFTPLGPTALVALGTSGIGNEAWKPPSPENNKNNNQEGNLSQVNEQENQTETEREKPPSSSVRRHQHKKSRSRSFSNPARLSEVSRATRPRSVSQPPTTASTTGRPYSGTEAASVAAVPRQPINQIFLRDMYIADSNGEPRWCNKCANWKPDRTHHCSEVRRCVEGFDHFCPWVGGVVGLTSYKFFVQFIFYGSLYCVYVVGVMAGYFVEKQRIYGFGGSDTHWIVCFGLGGFFGLFLVGMLISTLQLMYWGMTTLENFDRKTKRYYVAKLDPVQRDAVPASLHPSRQGDEESRSRKKSRAVMPPWEPKKDTEGLDSGYQRRVLLPLTNARPRTSDPGSVNSSGTTSTDSSTNKGQMAQRYYKLFLTPPGSKPWNLGFKENFKSIMGPTVVYWILPIHRPFFPPRSRDDGDLSDGSWSAKEYRSHMAAEGWASGYQGAARAREGARRSWWPWGPAFLAFFREDSAE